VVVKHAILRLAYVKLFRIRQNIETRIFAERSVETPTMETEKVSGKARHFTLDLHKVIFGQDRIFREVGGDTDHGNDLWEVSGNIDHGNDLWEVSGDIDHGNPTFFRTSH
jgi:hypothetical protein